MFASARVIDTLRGECLPPSFTCLCTIDEHHVCVCSLVLLSLVLLLAHSKEVLRLLLCLLQLPWSVGPDVQRVVEQAGEGHSDPAEESHAMRQMWVTGLVDSMCSSRAKREGKNRSGGE